MAISSTRSTGNNTKSAVAHRIFDEMQASDQVFTRKQVIERFISEAGLTPAGAATYYFKMNQKPKAEAAGTEPKPARTRRSK